MTITKSDLDYLKQGIMTEPLKQRSTNELIQELAYLVLDQQAVIKEALDYLDEAQDKLKDTIWDASGYVRQNAELAEEQVSQAKITLKEMELLD